MRVKIGFLVFMMMALGACGKTMNNGRVKVARTGKVVSYELTITSLEIMVNGQSVRQYRINEMSPGPVLMAGYGDELEVTVHNVTDVPLTIHWHGLLVPNDQDGVADVTGPAIAAGTTFTYRFPVVQHGTYWYHAHGLEEAQGVYGGIILTASNEMADSREMVLFAGELDENPEDVLARLNPPSNGVMHNHGMMSNGTMGGMNHSHMNHGMMGDAHFSDVTYAYHLVNGKRGETILEAPVENGKMRLRLVNTYVDGFLNLVYSGGDIEVVGSDGLPVEPARLKHLRMAMGETYDVLLPVAEGKAHELVAFFLGEEGHYSVAVAGTGERVGLPSYIYSDYNLEQPYNYLTSKEVSFFQLDNRQPTHNYRWMLSGDHDSYNWAIVERGEQLEQLDFKVGDKVRIRLHNMTMMPHPMHLHGHFFKVVSQPNHLVKHTFNLDPMDTMEIDFEVDAKGKWLFHCHNLFHMASGMMITFNVS
jgi:FtsP/CotA-like multicopper oxidase with cupredoxin domain